MCIPCTNNTLSSVTTRALSKVLPNILTYDDYCQFIEFDGSNAQELLKSGSELFSEAKMRIDRYTASIV